jgi:hypothetical protein
MFLITKFKIVVIRVYVFLLLLYQLYSVAQLVDEALRYKPKRRGFDSRWAIEISH